MPDAPKTGQAGERLAKVIARSGLCSRRDAEEWIKAGRVAVNGGVVRTPAFNVADKDRITVDGAPLAARKGTRVWLYHKPAGLMVTEKDPEGRPTIFAALAEEGLPRVVTVGRLDINTEGLLLLTNDGGLKRVLELPATGWLRRYRVRAHGTVTQAELDTLKEGVEVDGVRYGPIEALLERQQGANVWLVVALREGKNREVKNVLAKFGLAVNRLIRVSYGPFQLGDLPPGGVEVVKARVLREQLGKKLAAEAGVDFESELPEPAALAVTRKAETEAGQPPSRGRRHPGEGRREVGRRDAARPERSRSPERGRPAPRPSRRDELRRDASRAEGPTRRIFFDDGRPPEAYSPPPRRDRGRAEERDADRDKRTHGAKPAPGRGARPAGRPAPAGRRAPTTAEHGPRPGPKGPRSGNAPPKPEGGPRKPGARPSRPGAKPQRPRTGGKPAAPRGGGRPSRPQGPGGKPPRRPRGR